MPIAQSGHKIVGGKAGNRQSDIFAGLMKTAQQGGKGGGRSKAAAGDTRGEEAGAYTRPLLG